MRRAEAFFGADLSSVQVEISDAPRRLGAAAFAWGDAIFLTPQAASLPPPQLDEVLGHELAHVLQQRAGRVAARRQAGGFALNDDRALELEATELGRRFAYCPSARPPPAGAGRAREAKVAQPLVLVANSPISRLNGLSERAQLVLGFIRNGRDWLAWAMSAPAAKYDFADESRLLDSVQAGLHASPFLWMRRLGLLVSPIKLMTAMPRDLEIIGAAERGDVSAAERASNILAAHGLFTDAELEIGNGFLEELGALRSPLFQTMSLNDRIAIAQLAISAASRQTDGPDLRSEAATFAMEQGSTAREFADLYSAYEPLVTKTGALKLAPERRRAEAVRVTENLRACMYGSLDCPQIGGLAPPAEIGRVVQTWIGRGKQVGFARVAHGVLQIVQNTRFDASSSDAARASVSSYLREAQGFLRTRAPKGGRLGQDGATCVLPLESETYQGELELGASGQITLRLFRLKAAPSTSLARAAVSNPH